MPDPSEFEGYSLDESVPPGHRSGFVAVLGKPNAGKSTLMNRFLGEKLAIVSPRPQTTRTNQLGILTVDEAQIIFVDTPGIHLPKTLLGKYMVNRATGVISDVDVVLFIVDLADEPSRADEEIARMVNRQEEAQVVLVLNKRDLVDEALCGERAAAYGALVPGAHAAIISADHGDGCDALLADLIQMLPEGPRFYPADQLTETQERENVAEIIREQILAIFDQEVPHSVAVQVEEFKERGAGMTYIRATIYVERDSQKRIIIGEGGGKLKEIGKLARPPIEELVGTRVYLDLWVKVLKNWRKDPTALRRLGYDQES
ncbi:MAG: GTPase Era [Anaerolineae bacterium]|nr:GTPase Era [Anaerolineae bacterium]